MKDRLEQDINVGDVVIVLEHFEVNPQDHWVIRDFNDWRTAVEAVLENEHTKEIKWIPLWDIEKL